MIGTQDALTTVRWINGHTHRLFTAARRTATASAQRDVAPAVHVDPFSSVLIGLVGTQRELGAQRADQPGSDGDGPFAGRVYVINVVGVADPLHTDPATVGL